MEILYKNKADLICLLNSAFNRKVLDIKFEEEKHFENIIEYNFSISKAKIIYANDKEETVYLKIIKGGKIKETIFCFWSILYEEYLSDKDNREERDLIYKAIISQVSSDNGISNLILTLNSNLNYYAEIDLIELNKIKKERWEECIEINNNDILFIGKKKY